jgi:hypothetical protein
MGAQPQTTSSRYGLEETRVARVAPEKPRKTAWACRVHQLSGETRSGVAMTVQIPQGMLSLYEVIGRLVRRKFPDKDHTDKVEGEEAWRELCKHILAGRIRPYVLTESNESYEANCAQFVALQERYIFFADMLRYWSDEEQRYHYTEGDGPITDTLRDVDGHNKRGQLSFRESDLEALAEGSPENPSPGAVPVPRKLPASCNQITRVSAHARAL